MKKSFKNVLALCLVFCMAVGVWGGNTTVRAQETEAKKDYRIMVNRAANCVTVYEKDAQGTYSIPVRAFICSCGREGHETPLGTYKTRSAYEWRLMVDGTYGHYAVRFNRGIMFHSIPYYTKNPGDMEWDQYNLLGQPASLGCVRLTCADAKWIYDNCKAGTEVVVYDDANNPGPLGKPEEIKLAAENPYKTWDPTDMDANNPWNGIRPALHLTNEMGDGVMYLPVGATVADIYAALAVRTAQGEVCELGEYRLNMSGRYDLNSAGNYTVHVCGTDTLGVRTERDMIMCVQ